MTITRETLELAALAAGHEIDKLMQTDSGGLCIVGSDDDWMPHADIADAARLAVKLGIIVQPQGEIHVVHAWVTGWKYQCVREHVRHGGTLHDKERAYCKAITLCAAEIGQQMKEAK